MSRHVRIAAALALALAASSVLFAQIERRSGPGPDLPPYNVANETKIVGVVTGTEATATPTPLLVLNLAVDGKPMHVFVAPASWAKAHGIAFTKGATAEATGVADGMHYRGEPAMMARQIKVGAKVFAVRSADGTPGWEK